MITYTIVSRAYVPHARVLAKSFALHHPGSKLWALLIDDRDHQFNEDEEPFHILRLTDLDLDLGEVHRLEMLFSGKLIAVIKPWVFDFFLRRGADTVLYIDGDFRIYDRLGPEIEDATTGVILIPHVLQPVPRDGMDPNETTLLGAGMFNAGMFGVGRAHGGFIEFFQERLKRECIFDAPKMRFNEQRWLDFVPSLFPHLIVRDPGIDVAYWNLHERTLERRDEGWYVGEVPLRAFHFSSFDPRAKTVAGRFELDPAPRIRMATSPSLGELCDEYRAELLMNGFSELHNLPFSFDTLPDGSICYHSLRTLFTAAVLAAERGEGVYPPDPFDPAQVNEFRDWCERSYQAAGLPQPLRLHEGTAQRSHLLPRWRGLRRNPPKALGSGIEVSPTWSIDWLERMIVDSAAERTPAGCIHVWPDRAGFICHGPRASLDPGKYGVTLEWISSEGANSAGADEPVLVVEAFVQGYVVGFRTATFAEVRSGAVSLDIGIPEPFAQEALLFGLELRILTRGGLDAVLTAVVFDVLEGEVPPSWPDEVEWLPVLAGGVAGVRKGRSIETNGLSGVVASGPNWRLPVGSYVLNMVTALTNVDQSAGDIQQLGELEVMVGNRVLSRCTLTYDDFLRNSVQLAFIVAPTDAGPSDQVGIQLRVEDDCRAVITSLRIASVSPEGDCSVA